MGFMKTQVTLPYQFIGIYDLMVMVNLRQFMERKKKTFTDFESKIFRMLYFLNNRIITLSYKVRLVVFAGVSDKAYTGM